MKDAENGAAMQKEKEEEHIDSWVWLGRTCRRLVSQRRMLGIG